MSQEQFAIELGYAVVTYRKVEQSIQVPSTSFIERLAEYLLVPPSDYATFLHFAQGGAYPNPQSLLPYIPYIGTPPVLLQGPAAESLPPQAPCPYPGNVPFGDADRARFFAREHTIHKLLLQLSTHPFLALIGPSGSGKSSLLAAGLIPALRHSRLFGPGNSHICTLRPDSALLQLFVQQSSNTAIQFNQLRAMLSPDLHARRLLLVVDAFEEVSALPEDQRLLFQQLLLQVTTTADCFVILSVRTESDLSMVTRPLREAIQAHHFELPPLCELGLRDAIVRPAESVGVTVEDALVKRLIADVASKQHMLPLLQETMVRLWQQQEQHHLSLRTYETLLCP